MRASPSPAQTRRPDPVPHARQAGWERRWPAALPWVLVLLAAWLPYLPALQSEFTFDDVALIVENPYVAPDSPWSDTWLRPYWPPGHTAGLYRPLTSLTYRLQLSIWGANPLPFHAFNLLLHGACALLVLALMRRLIPQRRGLGLSIALLFAVHPIHTEAVTGIVGRAELLAALFGLGAYLCWLHPRRWAVAPALLLALAIASKESAVAWLGLCALHRLGLLGAPAGAAGSSGGWRRHLASDGWLLGVTALYVAARSAILGAPIGLEHVTAVDNPLYEAAWDMRLLTALSVLWRGIGLTLGPHSLSADYSYAAIPPVESWISGAGLLVPLSLGLIILVTALRRRMPLLFHGGLLYAVLILPVSNLILPIGTIMAERLLYLPSLGLLAMVALLLGRAGSRRRSLLPVLLALALLALGARSWVRNLDWRDNGTLFRAAVAAQPRSVKARANLGTWLVKAGETEEAERHYQAALAWVPTYPAALQGLAHIRILQARYAEAETLLLKARERFPRDPETALRLGNLYLEMDRPAEALAAFDQAERQARQRTDALIGRASALYLLERYADAVTAWYEAQRSAGASRDLRPHLAAALQALIRHHLAQGDCEAAEAVIPSEPFAALTPERQRALRELIEEACGPDRPPR